MAQYTLKFDQNAVGIPNDLKPSYSLEDAIFVAARIAANNTAFYNNEWGIVIDDEKVIGMQTVGVEIVLVS